MKIMFVLVFGIISGSTSAQSLIRKALVYGGGGACEEDCVTGAAEAARVAGFEPIIVYPKTYSSDLFTDAAVWIQPGGYATQSSKAMGKKMMADIRAFVKSGGGYVGFCAGAFLATSKIGTSSSTGLGISPGVTTLYKANKTYPSVEKVKIRLMDKWTDRDIYWEGGPYFKFSESEKKQVDVIGTYSKTNQISSIHTSYGLGKVALTGDHPEAPQWWRDYANLSDKDGLDYDITTQMIKFAAKK
jgi:hypothetical protein